MAALPELDLRSNSLVDLDPADALAWAHPIVAEWFLTQIRLRHRAAGARLARDPRAAKPRSSPRPLAPAKPSPHSSSPSTNFCASPSPARSRPPRRSSTSRRSRRSPTTCRRTSTARCARFSNSPLARGYLSPADPHRRPHRRHAAQRARPHAAQSAAHPGHHAGVALPAAHRGQIARASAPRPHRHRRRDSRRRRRQARRPPRADARAPGRAGVRRKPPLARRIPHRPQHAAAAHRPLRHAEPDRTGRRIPHRRVTIPTRQAAPTDRPGRPAPHARPRHRNSVRRTRLGDHQRDVGGGLRQARRARPRAPLHAGVRQHAAAWSRRSPSPSPNA